MTTDFTFIDLFAGIGGFYLGMKANGGRCVFTNEKDSKAAETYKAWHHHEVNTTEFQKLDFASDVPEHDILCAGFPCQPFSIAGVSKKNALGRAHGFRDAEQGNLFFKICELVEVRRPLVMILENVKNLLSHNSGATWQEIEKRLKRLNYQPIPRTIDAQAWVPQHRERVFIVCFDKERFTDAEWGSFEFPPTPKKKLRLSDVLEAEAPDTKYMLTDALWAYLQGYAEKHQAKGNGFGFGLASRDGITRTMSARYYKDGSEILIPEPDWRNPRRLTPAEAARLMGFTKRYAKLSHHRGEFPQVVSDMQAYKQFGNSVSPPVVEAIGKQVVKVLAMRNARLSAS